ncbi:hypothetical protein J19TS2_58970 [Cohnella xylanilytica]|nr:hypothetical protein J19TS2_58970 [Cohnella xylanilytica]
MAVFTVTDDARVTLYSEPAEAGTIKQVEGPWTVEERIETVPWTLLKDYVSVVIESLVSDKPSKIDREIEGPVQRPFFLCRVKGRNPQPFTLQIFKWASDAK